MGPGIERSSIVIAEFPYSNLTRTEIRPVVVLSRAGRQDWILVQLTRNPIGDPLAIQLTNESLSEGSLLFVSYYRPSKLFTADESLIRETIGQLKPEVFNRLLDATMDILDQNRMRQ